MFRRRLANWNRKDFPHNGSDMEATFTKKELTFTQTKMLAKHQLVARKEITNCLHIWPL